TDPLCGSCRQADLLPGPRNRAPHLRNGQRGHAIHHALRRSAADRGPGTEPAAGVLQSPTRGSLMLADLRYALRQLRKSPGFTLAAVITLALAIGANTAIYQLIDAVMFRPLPVREPERLVRIDWIENGKPRPFSYPAYLEFAARQQVADGVFATADH